MNIEKGYEFIDENSEITICYYNDKTVVFKNDIKTVCIVESGELEHDAIDSLLRMFENYCNNQNVKYKISCE